MTTDLSTKILEVPPLVWRRDLQPMDSKAMVVSLLFWLLSMVSIFVGEMSNLLMIFNDIPRIAVVCEEVHGDVYENMHLMGWIGEVAYKVCNASRTTRGFWNQSRLDSKWGDRER